MKTHMKFREYVDLVLHPNRFMRQYRKWQAYAAILEKRINFDPNSKRVALVGMDNAEALVILGDEAYVKDCVFHPGQMIVIHPDARHIVINGCNFIGRNLKEIGVDL